MIVTCRFIRIDAIPEQELRDHVRKRVHLDELNLVVGAAYQVFGIFFVDNIQWYLVCKDSYDTYPVPMCSIFFDVLDSRIPNGWAFSPHSPNLGGPAFLPEIWARDPAFLEKLVDNDSEAIEAFLRMKLPGR